VLWVMSCGVTRWWLVVCWIEDGRCAWWANGQIYRVRGEEGERGGDAIPRGVRGKGGWRSYKVRGEGG